MLCPVVVLWRVWCRVRVAIVMPQPAVIHQTVTGPHRLAHGKTQAERAADRPGRRSGTGSVLASRHGDGDAEADHREPADSSDQGEPLR